MRCSRGLLQTVRPLPLFPFEQEAVSDAKQRHLAAALYFYSYVLKITYQFCLFIFIARQHDIDIANLSICPSVCPSVCPTVRDVPVSDENGLTYRHSFFRHTLAQSFQFYQHQTNSRNSDWVTPYGGTKYRWGITISRFWTNNSLYLANDTRYRHSYYEK